MISQETNQTASWKHPWSLEEIVNSSRSWSLAADYGVCELLKKFSTDILNEVTQLNNNINELSIESRQTNVIIQNAFNDFCMLANNQFMENLVEDANSSLLNEENDKELAENSFSKEDKVAQLNTQVSESIKLGIQVLENQFEILDVQKVNRDALVNQDSDSEPVTNSPFESGNNEPIYHPKDPYEHRHLPHLIGTTEFVEDETLGIGYLDELEESSEDFEVDSDHSERNEVLNYLSSDSSGDSVAEDIEISTSRKKYSSYSDSSFDKKSKDIEDDISRESEDLFNDKSMHPTIKKIPQDSVPVKTLTMQEQLQEQLKKKLGLTKTESSSSLTGSTTDIPVAIADSGGPGYDEEIMYSTVPLPHSADDFLESDDDDYKSIDMFSELLPSNKKTATVSSIAKPPISVIVSSAADVAIKQKPLDIKPPAEVFSDSDDDDDIFKSYTKVPFTTISTPNAAPKRLSPIKPLDLESDSDSDIFKEKLLPKPETKQAILTKSATVPSKGKLAPSVNKPPEKSQFKPPPFILDDEDDEDDFEYLFKPSLSKPAIKADSLKTNKEVPAVTGGLNQTIGQDPLFQVANSAMEPDVPQPSAKIALDLEQNSNQIEQFSSTKDKMEKPEPAEKKLMHEQDTPGAKKEPFPNLSEDSGNEDMFEDMFKKKLSTSTKIKPEVPVTVVDQVTSTTFVVVDHDIEDQINQKPTPIQETITSQPIVSENNALKPDEPKRKLPAGAVDPFGDLFPSKNLLSELQSRQIIKSSVMTEPDQGEPDPTPLKRSIRENASRSSFADQLQQSLSKPRPMGIPIKSSQSKLTEASEEPDIDLEEPVHKVNQLTLLTKSRVRNMPRRRPTTKRTSDDTESNPIVANEQDNREASSATSDLPSDIPKQSIDSSINIFADLPPRTDKKSKINKKTKKGSKPVADVNIEDIDDIFAIPNSKPSKRAKSKVTDDPLGAM